MGLIVNFSDFENISASGLTLSDYIIGYKSGPNREIRTTIADLINFLESASANDLYLALSPNSAKWNSAYSTVNSLSDSWEESAFITPLQNASGSWNSAYSTVNSLSDSWEESAIISPLQSASASWNSVYSSFNSSSASIIIDGGNLRYNSDPTIIIGTNSDQHLRFRAGGATSSQIRMTVLSSGEVGINTTLAQTKSPTISSVTNGDFSNLTGLTANGPEWYNGMPSDWSGTMTTAPVGQYTVKNIGGNYVANIDQLAAGSGASSFQQSLGTLPILSDIILTFDANVLNANPFTLNAAIYSSGYTVLATNTYSSAGSYSLIASNVPAGTTITIGFWTTLGQPSIDNVSVTQVDSIKLTTLGGVSATSLITGKMQVHDGTLILSNLPTSSTGLPAGTVWNNSGFLNLVNTSASYFDLSLVATTSASWNSAYSTLNANSANWSNVSVLSTNATFLSISADNFDIYNGKILNVRSGANLRINFESSLPAGFNLSVLNETTFNVTLTSSVDGVYKSFGTVLSGSNGAKNLYSSATVYKYGANVFAIGSIV